MRAPKTYGSARGVGSDPPPETPCQSRSFRPRVKFFTSKCIYRSSGVVWNTFWTHLTTFGYLRKSSKKISRTRKSQISKIWNLKNFSFWIFLTERWEIECQTLRSIFFIIFLWFFNLITFPRPPPSFDLQRGGQIWPPPAWNDITFSILGTSDPLTPKNFLSSF